MRKAVFTLFVLALVVSAAGADGEYKRWKLDFTHGDPSYVVLENALGEVRLAWYVTYTVENNTEQDVPLHIKFSAVTDTKQSYRDSVDPEAHKLLQERTGRKYKNALEMTRGTIGAGEKIEAVAFLGELDPNFDWLHVEVAGLYDKLDQVDGKVYLENKVLVLTWYRPGDEFGAAGDEITFKGKKWVIKGEREEIPQQSSAR